MGLRSNQTDTPPKKTTHSTAASVHWRYPPAIRVYWPQLGVLLVPGTAPIVHVVCAEVHQEGLGAVPRSVTFQGVEQLGGDVHLQ